MTENKSSSISSNQQPANKMDSKVVANDSSTISSLTNAIAGTGTSQDARTYGAFGFSPRITPLVANNLYDSVWMARKIVDIPAEDMIKNWRTISAPTLDTNLIDKIQETEKSLFIKPKMLTALQWSRLFGGSLLLLGVRDGKPLNEPLEVDKIREGDLEFIQVLDMYRVGIMDVNTFDPFSDSYLDPQFYNIFGQTVHSSRVIKFIGLQATYETIASYQYFGASVLQPIYETIRDAVQGLAAGSNITLKSSQDVINTSNLWDFVGTVDENKITKRFAMMQLHRSMLNMLVLDKDEEYQNVPASFAGLEGLLDKLLNMVVGASGIPATKFFGQSPNGFNATGESDLRNYYDTISSGQENTVAPRLQKLDEVMIRSAIGFMPDDYSFEFNSLWQTTELEETELQGKKIDNLAKLSDLGFPDEVIMNDAIEMKVSKNLTKELVDELLQNVDLTEGDEGSDDLIPTK